jgi:hypothetical protein
MTIAIPKEILWDYTEPPEDLLWRLQRIADFFPPMARNGKRSDFFFRIKEN